MIFESKLIKWEQINYQEYIVFYNNVELKVQIGEFHPGTRFSYAYFLDEDPIKLVLIKSCDTYEHKMKYTYELHLNVGKELSIKTI